MRLEVATLPPAAPALVLDGQLFYPVRANVATWSLEDGAGVPPLWLACAAADGDAARDLLEGGAAADGAVYRRVDGGGIEDGCTLPPLRPLGSSDHAERQVEQEEPAGEHQQHEVNHGPARDRGAVRVVHRATEHGARRRALRPRGGRQPPARRAPDAMRDASSTPRRQGSGIA